MLIFKPIDLIRRSAVYGLATLLSTMLHAGGVGGPGDAAAREQARRAVAVQEAQELLLKGDEAYAAGKFAEAIEAFGGARVLIPDAPQTRELRSAATERYAQAAVEQGRILSRKGDMDGAKALLDKVLSEDVAPRHAGALAFRAQLDDPIRSNPALDAAHTRDVDEVRRLLYTAQGAFDLGKFDEAIQHYEDVLRIDPTNSAARRGMEKTAAAKREYSKAAYDDTRAEMLSQVDSSWEKEVPASEQGLNLPKLQSSDSASTAISLKAKLDQIIIPNIALDQSSLDEALDLLRLKATENDNVELDPARRGVNFAVDLGPPDSDTAKRIRELRFDLRLSQVPLSKVLKYLTDVTHTDFRTDEFSVLITPAGLSLSDLVSRSYRVPPDFLTTLNSGAGGAEKGATDPFAEAPEKTGLLTARLSAQEALIKQGVPFPNGASAHYSAATNMLRVVNTEVNQDTIAQIIETMTQSEPVAVSVQVTMIRTQQSNLEELGFDWLLSGAGDPLGKVGVAGGTIGNGTPRTASDFTGNPTLNAPEGIMTAGNRSGDTAIGRNSIDSLIKNPDRTSQVVNVAPGVLSLTGVFGDAEFKTIMRGLDQKKGVDIMARPSVVTRSGQASNVAIVREFIYPTEYEPPEVPQSVDAVGGFVPVTPAMPTAFDKRDVGITLEVLPVADAEKRYIDLTLNPSFVDFDGFVDYGSPIRSSSQGILGIETVELTKNSILMPVFSAQKLATQLTVADGATIAIGGLMTQSTQNVDDKVPVLGQLPVVGRMFSSKGRESISTALIFLVRVNLIDPTGHPYRNR